MRVFFSSGDASGARRQYSAGMDAAKSKELYERYRAVVARTTIVAHYHKPGQELTPQYISPEDLKLRAELHDELRKHHMAWLSKNLDPGALLEFEQDG